MSSYLLTRRQRIAGDAQAFQKKRKRDESATALIFALLIGVFAALGIVVLASSETTDQAASGAATEQASGLR